MTIQSGKNAHTNLGTSYEKAKTVTVSESIHKELTNDRVNAEKAGNPGIIGSQRELIMAQSLERKITPQDISDLRQYRDKQTIQQIADIGFERTGASKDSYIESSQQIHQADRTNLSRLQHRLELSPDEHTKFAQVKNNNFSDYNQCQKAVLALEDVPIRYLNKTEKANSIHPLLGRLITTERFSVGIRYNFPANSSLAKAIDIALLNSGKGKKVLFKTLRDKGLPVEEIYMIAQTNRRFVCAIIVTLRVTMFTTSSLSNPTLGKFNKVFYIESYFYTYQ